jgi:hypothetical protein
MQNSARTWGYGLGNQILLGFLAALMAGVAVFLVWLPSIAGAPGDAGINWMIYATAAVMFGFALFVSFALVSLVRTRISLDGAFLDATVPARHNALLVPSFRAIHLPIAEICSVERRQEVTRGLISSTLRESLSVVTAAGERVGLFSNTLGPSMQLPMDEIAGAIAGAAGVGVTDDGIVLTQAPGLYGQASSNWTERPMDPVSANKARRRALLTLQICGALVLLTIALRACT